MRILKIFLFFFWISSFLSCLSARVTQIEFKKGDDCKESYDGYEYSAYFPFKLDRPFYKDTNNELEFSAFLVLADSSLKIRLLQVQPYLVKNNDTIKLEATEQFARYSYPNIVNEPRLNIHLEYTVEKKADGTVREIKEDLLLYRCSNTFRSIH